MEFTTFGLSASSCWYNLAWPRIYNLVEAGYKEEIKIVVAVAWYFNDNFLFTNLWHFN